MSSENSDNKKLQQIESELLKNISDTIRRVGGALTDETLTVDQLYDLADINNLCKTRMEGSHELHRLFVSPMQDSNKRGSDLNNPKMLEALGGFASFNTLTGVWFEFSENNHKILPKLLERLSKNPSIISASVMLSYESTWRNETDLIEALARFKIVVIGEEEKENPLGVIQQISHSKELESLDLSCFGKRLELPKRFKWPQGTNLQKLCIIKLPFDGFADTCQLSDALTFYSKFRNLYDIDLKALYALANTSNDTKMLVSALKKLPKLISLGEYADIDLNSNDGPQKQDSLYQHVAQNKQRFVKKISNIVDNHQPMHEFDLAILRSLLYDKYNEYYGGRRQQYDKMFPNIGDQIVAQYLDPEYYNEHILGGWGPQTHTCDASTQTEILVTGDVAECGD